ncbi:hypothetical protein [Candidatus Binatus sp.]|uniref:hypothetical protein n=1 Tax=Candidatus Binatus sp. TaxID=2811406 RepID=UPI003BB01112
MQSVLFEARIIRCHTSDTFSNQGVSKFSLFSGMALHRFEHCHQICGSELSGFVNFIVAGVASVEDQYRFPRRQGCRYIRKAVLLRRYHQIPAHKRERGCVAGLHRG